MTIGRLSLLRQHRSRSWLDGFRREWRRRPLPGDSPWRRRYRFIDVRVQR